MSRIVIMESPGITRLELDIACGSGTVRPRVI